MQQYQHPHEEALALAVKVLAAPDKYSFEAYMFAKAYMQLNNDYLIVTEELEMKS